MASNATSSTPQPGMASTSTQTTPEPGIASTPTTQPTAAALHALMSDYSQYKVESGNLEIPEYCFKKTADLSLRDNDKTRSNKPNEAEEARNIVNTVGVILSALMNTSGGVLHIHHIKSDNKTIDGWLNTLSDKLSYIPKSAFDECISLDIVGGQEVFMYVRKYRTIIVRTHIYSRSPVGSSSEADLSRARQIISRTMRPLHASMKMFSCIEFQYDCVMPSEGMHREYKHYSQVRNVTMLIQKISGCFKDILSLANCQGGGCFVIGIDDKSLKVKGIHLNEADKVSFKEWICNNLKESNGHKRIWGNVSHVPEEGLDWTLSYIPVANHPDGSDHYVCVLTMNQCLGGVFTEGPEYYIFDISGEIYRQPYAELIALLTSSPKQKQTFEHRIPAKLSSLASSSPPSTSQSGNNTTNEQTDRSSLSQTISTTNLPFFRVALWSRCVKWETLTDRVGSADTKSRANLPMTNPLNIVGEGHIIEHNSGICLNDFYKRLRSEFTHGKGFAFFVCSLGDCVTGCTVQRPADHFFDVVVFSENCRLCLISCFKEYHRSGSNLRGDDVAFEVVEQALEDSRENKLLNVLMRLIVSTGDHRYTEKDIMLLLCDGDDKEANTLRKIIIRHSNYKPCTAKDVPHEGVVVDVVDAAVGLEASVCILVWLKDTTNTDNVKFRVFAASRGVMRVNLVYPRYFSPEEARKLGLQDLTSVTGRITYDEARQLGLQNPTSVTKNMPDRYNPAAVRNVWLSEVVGGIHGLTVSPNGEIYLADAENRQIRVMSAECKHRSVIPISVRYGPWDVCVTSTGSVAVACDNKVRLYDRDGSQIWEMGSRGDGPEQYTAAVGITSDGAGRLYVADYINHRVTVLDSSAGTFLRYIGADPGEGRLERPWSVAVHPHTGLVYVADRDRRVVAVYNQDGGYKHQITGVLYPLYITFRPDSLLAVCSYEIINGVYNWSVYLMRHGSLKQKLSVGTGSLRPSVGFLPGGELVVCHYNGQLQIYATHF